MHKAHCPKASCLRLPYFLSYSVFSPFSYSLRVTPKVILQHAAFLSLLLVQQKASTPFTMYQSKQALNKDVPRIDVPQLLLHAHLDY